MKISIITISFNSAKTIERTIKSVLDQNYPNLEYIIIDGESKDNTLNIINQYKDNIAKIISEPDKGISDAFNKGIKLATGDIIGILNSDDWHEPETLKIVADKLSDPGADFIIGCLKYWNEQGDNFTVLPDKNYFRKIGYKMPHMNHPASFFKKSVYDSIGLFNKKYKYAMDYDFFLRVIRNNKKPVFTNEVLANMSFAGASDKNAIKAYWETFEIADKKIIALPYFVYSAAKYYLRLILNIFGLNKLLLLIRKLKYHNKLK